MSDVIATRVGALKDVNEVHAFEKYDGRDGEIRTHDLPGPTGTL